MSLGAAAGRGTLLSLGHVTIRSADFAHTDRFYRDLLGMHCGPRPAIREPGAWYYVGATAVLHVLPATAAACGTTGAVDHFALEARDRRAFERRLAAAGQPFAGRRLADSDTWQIFVTDPDGVRVELCFAGEADAGGD